MISIEGFKAFHGDLIVRSVNGVEPLTLTGDWLYKPDCDCWYGGGQSFPADICEAVEVDRVAELEKLAIQQGAELNRRAELFYRLESRYKEAMELLEKAISDIPHICETCSVEKRADENCWCNKELKNCIFDSWRWQYANQYKALKAKENGSDASQKED